MLRGKKLLTCAGKKYINNLRSCEIGRDNKGCASDPKHGKMRQLLDDDNNFNSSKVNCCEDFMIV